MSEPIPEAIPTSQDSKSHRPLKRRALSPSSAQASAVTSLFADPDREVRTDGSVVSKRRADGITPEIVNNVQGSSSGAGSGEFHVYKAARRREYERIASMEAAADKEDQDREYDAKRKAVRLADQEREEKKRAKRRGKGKGKKSNLSWVSAAKLEVKKNGVDSGRNGGEDEGEAGTARPDTNGAVNGYKQGEGGGQVIATAVPEGGFTIHDDDDDDDDD